MRRLSGLLFVWIGAIGAARAQEVTPPKMTPLRKDVKPFKYVDAKIAYYPPSAKWGTQGKGPTEMQLPVEPAESMKHMVMPVDFDVKLFASDPQIKRPICMNWDERGRLWIAESIDYPNERAPQGQGRDRIVICEDTDGDGIADKFTVFADNLSIPTSFAFANGGIVVHQAPHTLFLKDNDGDDVADERKILFSGWLTYDTHAGPSNLHYGFDNWLYGIVGYAGFNGEVGGEQHNFRQGFYRFKADGSKLEFLRSTNNNSWGVGFSEEGLLFGSTANGNPSVYLPIPNRYYEGVRGFAPTVLGGIAGNAPMHPITDKVRQVDYHGRFTAAAGHALYTARLYPREYWNRAAFVNEPTGHLIATFQLQRDGTDFRSKNAWNLLASDDEWTAPIMAEVGPDGCVWIIDWYNYIVQHNPTPAGFKTGKGAAYETPLRDKKHGRIYRLVPKDGKVATTLNLKNATPEKLVAALKNDNLFWRRHAQRLLVERGKLDVQNALAELVNDQTVDAIGINPGAIHALWTLKGLGVLDAANARAAPTVVAALKHKSAAVRRNAVAVLPRTDESIKAILEAKLVDDADAHVRLATLLALAEMPPSESAGRAVAAALSRADNLSDRWIPDALTSAAATHNLGFLAALTSVKQAPKGRAADILAVVTEHYARGGPAKSVLNLLTTLGAAEPKVAETIVAGIAKGWPKSTPVNLDAQGEDALRQLLPKLTPTAKGKLIVLASTWGSKAFAAHVAELSKSLLALIENEKETDEQRVNAARQLVELTANDGQTLEKLLDMVSPRVSPALAEGIIEAVGSNAGASTASALIKRLGGLTPSARAAGLRVLLARPEATRILLAEMEKGRVAMTELSLDQREALSQHPDRKIAFRAKKILAKSGGLPNADRQKVVDELMPLTQRSGNATEGKLVFKKHCATCHMHAGEGSKIGPDLTGMATHPKSEILINIIDPSRSVEGNYRVYTLVTVDGRVLSGLLSSETKTAVEIIDAQAQKIVVQRADIEQIAASNKSLMPDGFEKQITPDELVNLLEFLTQRGQYLPLPLTKIATVVSTQGMFFTKESTIERLVLPDWSPKTVKGVPFHFVDPQGDKVPNVLMLYGPQGTTPPTMPKSAKLTCNGPAKAIHLLSGVSGWGSPNGKTGSVSMIVRLHYADGKTEDHPLRNGEHFADYIRRVDVPKSEFAFAMRGKQMRYLAIQPKRSDPIAEIEFVKGEDQSAPLVMAVTVETR